MTDMDTSYLVLPDDEYPPSVTMFEPDYNAHRVVFSMHRFGLFDEDEGYCVEEFDSERRAYDARNAAMIEAGLATMVDGEFTITDEYDEPRFHVEDAQWMDSAPSWFFDGEFGCVYIHTDGWRGYSQVTHNDQWEAYAGGWVTGYPDDSTQYKVVAGTLLEALSTGYITPPFPIVWFFGVTSNVFSTSSDLLVPAGLSDEFEAWLASVNFDPEEVSHAFN